MLITGLQMLKRDLGPVNDFGTKLQFAIKIISLKSYSKYKN